MPDWFPPKICRHLMAVGVLGLLCIYPEVNAVAGAMFGVGFTGWLFHKLAGGPV